jgi:hypothetical protein
VALTSGTKLAAPQVSATIHGGEAAVNIKVTCAAKKLGRHGRKCSRRQVNRLVRSRTSLTLEI